MSDTTMYTLAADLTDYLATAVLDINLPEGCEAPERVYTSAGQPDAWNCSEIAVWATTVSPSDLPNREQTVDQSVCASTTYVEITWRLTQCISKSTDGKSPISVEDHEADAECINTLMFGIYRRVMANLSTIWDVDVCKKITGGLLEVGPRQGGMISAAQSFRVAVDLTDPASDSS